MKMEIWKDIQGYEGLYQVSNYGNMKRRDNMDDKELQDKKEKLVEEYADLLRQSDKTTKIEILVPHVESLEELKRVSPLVSVKCKDLVSSAFLVLTMEQTIDELYDRRPELKKMVKHLDKYTSCTTDVVVEPKANE